MPFREMLYPVAKIVKDTKGREAKMGVVKDNIKAVPLAQKMSYLEGFVRHAMDIMRSAHEPTQPAIPKFEKAVASNLTQQISNACNAAYGRDPLDGRNWNKADIDHEAIENDKQAVMDAIIELLEEAKGNNTAKDVFSRYKINHDALIEELRNYKPTLSAIGTPLTRWEKGDRGVPCLPFD